MATKKKAAKTAAKKIFGPCVGDYARWKDEDVVVAKVVDGKVTLIARKGDLGWKDECESGSYKAPAGYDSFWWVLGKEVTIVKRGKGGVFKEAPKPELGMKFALKYDLDRDPVELFATKVEVRARIAELVKDRRDLKRDSIWVYKLSAPKHIKVSTAISTF